ncbi:MAG: signal peptidase I [Planctomycetota bacterium]|nr:signal peptidase I [Planctomycetota bacterium]
MSATTDDKAEARLLDAVARDPADVLDLLSALRTELGTSLARQEGAAHVLVHRLMRAGRLTVVGRSARGLALYAANSGGRQADFEGLASDGTAAPKGVARAARSMAGAVRDPADRGRVLSDVRAHLESLDASGAQGAFGRVKTTVDALRRVDRGKRAVVLVADGGERLRRFLWHEGPWILGATIVFVVLKMFVVSPYKIPSESMLPTLERGDRVAVFPLFAPDIPDRWDVVVFVRDGVNYVKRLVGLPGEEIALWQGDIYIDGALQVKPAWLNEALRSRVGRWTLGAQDLPGFARESRDGSTRWWWRTGQFEAHAGGPLPFGLHDGYAVLEGARQSPDLWTLVLAFGPAGERAEGFGWALHLGPDGVELREVRGGDLTARPEAAEGEGLVRVPAGPQAGGTRLELAYIDGVLRARAGSWHVELPREAPVGDLSVGVVRRAAVATDLTLTLDRDQHWGYGGGATHGVPVAGERHGHRVGEGAVFFMGDNTTNSQDSRFAAVGDIPVDNLVGPVRVRIWPPSRVGRVR